MASLERKQQFCSLITQQRNPLIRTSAEIVSEARRSLRVRSTQRPFTPAIATRELFGNKDCMKKRPPSTFSLHACDFEAPESRPASAVRLSRLEHKPKLPVPCSEEDQFKAFPKPPAEPEEVKNQLAGARLSLRRAGSLALLPLERQTNAERQLRPDRTGHRGPHNARPRRAVSERRMVSVGDDSGVRPTEGRSGGSTERRDHDACTSVREDAQSLVWNYTITPILQKLESVSAGSEASVDRLCDLCDRLHSALEGADMLGRSCKRRSAILRTLFRLIDADSARLSLRIAELCLALAVSGNNLLNICKLVFQISRSESNDVLFQRNSIIESFLAVLTNEDVSTSGEALLYCAGALKFLSGNSSMVKLLLDNGCIAVSQKLIRRLCTAEKDSFTMAGHILVQLTAALRNLADHPDARPVFVSCGIFSDLCLVLRLHSQDQNICTNISRVCSKLSSYSECRHALANTPDCFPLFLEVMSKHRQRQDLIVRFLFTLGNLTASVEASRQQLFECTGCAGVLLQLYDRYQRRGGAAARAAEDEDVLVKLLRVLANMCIHPAVGPALAASEACVELLLETLGERRPALSAPDRQHRRMWSSGMFTFLQFARSKFLTTSFAFRTICVFTPSPAFLCAHLDTAHPLLLDLNSLSGTPRCMRRMFCHMAPSTCEILPCGSKVSGRVELRPRCLQKLSLASHASHTTVEQQKLKPLKALRSVRESEELVVNAAATINNLSFYQAEGSALDRSRLAVAKLMMQLLLSASMDAVLEATRVFGNLSQSKDVRSVIMQHKAHRFVVALLDSESTEMCYSACGVLTNLSLDSAARVRLSREGAVAKLVDCLIHLGAGDWQLAGQVCQALCNMIGGGSEKLLDTKERDSLLRILGTFRDKEEVLCWMEHGDRRDHLACWELEFLPVAQRLMTFLQRDAVVETCI
ncbi:armadillo repeat-containing protein 2 isoform X1 [Takifugu flavidus]|uniref:armadillo repeat-containing protein 2 isoform X1 n=1 Tax=Takifugu flavidus TaxID=433684 RepID=UPI0025447554|nr:armadillo repeat-containing protein 2 isoform X1 [Takifugu flavidus]